MSAFGGKADMLFGSQFRRQGSRLVADAQSTAFCWAARGGGAIAAMERRDVTPEGNVATYALQFGRDRLVSVGSRWGFSSVCTSPRRVRNTCQPAHR